MTTPAPPSVLADVQRMAARLAAAPPIFFSPVDPAQSGNVVLEAILADLFRERASRAASAEELAALRFPMTAKGKARQLARKHHAVALVASWLLHDEAFQGMDAAALAAFLATPLRALSSLVLARAFVEDSDRREELVRTCLHAFAIAPAGESASDAQDRRESLDSVRRTTLLKQAKAREEARERERKKKLEELRAQEEAAAREAARATFED
jgi:hypothetical protein